MTNGSNNNKNNDKKSIAIPGVTGNELIVNSIKYSYIARVRSRETKLDLT